MRTTTSLIFLTLCQLLALAATPLQPVAVVTSAQPFTLNGRSVEAAGGSSVALSIDSEIATHDSAAILVFPEGSSVTLARSSRAKLTGSESHLKLVLLGGALDYKLVLGSNLSITNLDVERKAKEAVSSSPRIAKPLPAAKPDEVNFIRSSPR